jgi:glucokinase
MTPACAQRPPCSRSPAPIDGGDEVALTNRTWRFRQSALARRFGFAALRVVNDFEAIAWALPRLGADDARPLGEPREPRAGVKVALGPGTGLGVAALVPVEGRWHVVPSEGGHASFGAQAPDEIDIFARLLREHGSVSAEAVLSGPGLARLVHAIDPQAAPRTPEGVVAGALAREAAPLAAVRLFVRLLGRFAGGLALTFRPSAAFISPAAWPRGSALSSTSANSAPPSKRIRRMRHSCAQRPHCSCTGPSRASWAARRWRTKWLRG